MITRLFHSNSAAACESLVDTASVSHCSSGNTSGREPVGWTAVRQPEGQASGRERVNMEDTAVVPMHRLPCLHQAARRLATNHHKTGGLTRLFQLPAYFYRWILSPFLHALCGPGCGCRYTPSCSCYWIEALSKHGTWHGLLLGVKRLLRCHPWSPGGIDPVP